MNKIKTQVQNLKYYFYTKHWEKLAPSSPTSYTHKHIHKYKYHLLKLLCNYSLLIMISLPSKADSFTLFRDIVNKL